jgi:hypothetical protein
MLKDVRYSKYEIVIVTVKRMRLFCNKAGRVMIQQRKGKETILVSPVLRMLGMDRYAVSRIVQ